MSYKKNDLELLDKVTVHEVQTNPSGINDIIHVNDTFSSLGGESDLWTQVTDSNSTIGDTESMLPWVVDKNKDNQNEELEFIDSKADEILVDEESSSIFDNMNLFDW